MNDKLKAAKVPQGRLARLSGMGGLAGRIAGNVLVESGKQLAQGQRPQLTDVLLTERNLTHLADKLAKMRGAAMKVGQLLSMDAGNLIPPEFAVILERLRSEGMTMPAAQLYDVLESNWGSEWQAPFSRFTFDPVAAASIGQVHRAHTHDGRDLAVKIQYPGVKASIDSDINNVVSLLRMSGLLPKSLDIDPLVEEARRQLHLEAGYLHEGEQIRSYTALLEGYEHRDRVLVPEYMEDLSTDQILTMSFVDGVPLEKALIGASARTDNAMTVLLDLMFAELSQFHCVQTDPNPANYLYDKATDRIVLLDFGAVRSFSTEFTGRYMSALSAAVDQNREALRDALEMLGFFQQGISVSNTQTVLDIFMLATEPLRSSETYDFGASDLSARIHALGQSISSDPDAWHTPPPDVLFLHRKIAGLYLIAMRVGARVPTGEIFEKYRGMSGV